MRVAVFGCGYVGLVTGACLAEVGNQVVGVDIDHDRVALLNQGDVPIYEPGLGEIIRRGLTEQNLHFTADAAAAIHQAEVIFIAVGTPPDEDGSADLSHVLAVAGTIGAHLLRDDTMIVVKSTVPVGTCQRVRQTIQQSLRRSLRFTVASNPEFLKEGAAIDDFKKPDRIIIGIESEEQIEPLRRLYAPFNRHREKLVVMDIPSAELTKYAANAMLATRISFINEMAQIAQRVGADIEQVRQGIGSDPRIGYAFIYPGVGYGGSCFPKDIHALRQTARSCHYQPRLLDAVEAVNHAQKRFLFEQIQRYFQYQLNGKTIALWGLAFKPNTDDMREAPSRVLMEQLWAAGVNVKAYDPKALTRARQIYADHPALELCDDPYQALSGADALAVVTEWKAFWSPDFQRIKQLLKQAVIFDGRNIYHPQQMRNLDITHISIGREPVIHEPALATEKTDPSPIALAS
ncbi:MAG: UDP-glucose/GDP-mannose dehydrogenase family protein [Wenzhouxiangellaceae bacterium]